MDSMSVGNGGLTVNPGDWWQVVRDLVISRPSSSFRWRLAVPEWLEELRHETTHGQMLGLTVLRAAG